MIHKHRVRGLVAVAASICAMLAFAASASARSDYAPPGGSDYALPGGFQSDSASGSESSASALPSTFRSDTASNNPAPAEPAPSHALPSDFRSDAASPSPSSSTSTSAPPVIEQIIEEEGAPTLAIVLASIALLVALMGTGYMVATSVQRRHAGGAA
jgi:hypothetical protein